MMSYGKVQGLHHFIGFIGSIGFIGFIGAIGAIGAIGQNQLPVGPVDHEVIAGESVPQVVTTAGPPVPQWVEYPRPGEPEDQE